ncbi:MULTISPECIES: hypothetical protein [unclassified Ruegeria]|uniref:hypothetical protein n=1 Tax=unclassified Ruegeria TaxID=2625375 RepID=UPI00148778E0|nr:MULTISPECIES: hypothetical protein [unclassified Ruegeria]
MSQQEENPDKTVAWRDAVVRPENHLWYWVALLVAVALLAIEVLWPMQIVPLSQEGGLLETISAAALFTAGIVALVRYPGLKRLYLGVVCFLLAERELEADVYAPDSLPFAILNGLDWALDLTAVRVVLLLVVLYGLVLHGVPTAWKAIKARAPFLIVFVLAGLMAVIAQVLEEISGAYGASLSVTAMTRLFVLEETLEMFFSIGLLASVLIGWPKRQTEESLNDTPLPTGRNTR